MRRTLVTLAAVALFGGTAFGQTTFDITAERVGSGDINPGDTVDYQIVVELSDRDISEVHGVANLR